MLSYAVRICLLYCICVFLMYLSFSYGDTFLGLMYDGTEDFDCPVCCGSCNCTTCTAKRCEAYVGARRDDTLGVTASRSTARTVKRANYGPKSVVAKRKPPQRPSPSPASATNSPMPRTIVKRIRLLLPETPPPPPPQPLRRRCPRPPPRGRWQRRGGSTSTLRRSRR